VGDEKKKARFGEKDQKDIQSHQRSFQPKSKKKKIVVVLLKVESNRGCPNAYEKKKKQEESAWRAGT